MSSQRGGDLAPFGPHLREADTSANTARGLYGKSKFKFDEQRDVYVCPAGGELNYRFSTYELGRELRYYRARGCRECSLKSQCTRNKANRTITREANEHLMEAMAERMKREPGKFRLRKTLAERQSSATPGLRGELQTTAPPGVGCSVLLGHEILMTQWAKYF